MTNIPTSSTPRQGQGGASRPPGESPPTRACLQSISRRDQAIVIPRNGSVCQLKLQPERKREQVIAPEYMETGTAVRYRDPMRELLSEERGRGGKRGEVRGFSRKSRQRLLIVMASIDYEAAGLPVFLTLTYPGEWDNNPGKWKRDLDVFLHALKRQWPEVWGTWKLEFQKRGAPHFHALLWDGPKVKGIEAQRCNGKFCVVPDVSDPETLKLFNWMSTTWYRIVGSGDEKHLVAGTRIEPVKSRQGVMSYTGKYLGKTGGGEEYPEGIGRVWGVIGRDRWKSDPVESRLDHEEYMRIRRVMRKWRERKLGKKDRYKSRITGMNVFMKAETAERLKAWALEHRNGCPF